MRPISTLLVFQLACIGAGYLFAEGCVSIRYGNRPHATPLLTALATSHCPVILLLSLLWAGYALYAERTFQSKAGREYLPLGLGIAGAVFLFFFFIVVGLATIAQPIHLHG